MMEFKASSFVLLVLIAGFIPSTTAAAATVNAFEGETCSRDDVECKEKLSLKDKLMEFEQEMNKYKSILEASNCSICNVNGDNPCHNGGTCVTLDKYSYICQCPDNYAGKYCDTPIVCGPGDCGKNAYCTVFNHKKVCSCPIGYGGNPHSQCSVKTSKACLHGDPHYITFDGSHYDYQGTCPYVLTKTCADDSFRIVVTNKFFSRRTVSYVDLVRITIRGTEFYFDDHFHLYVNGYRAFYPYFYPSAFNTQVLVTRSCTKIVVTDRVSGARVDYSITGTPQLCVTLPQSTQFYGPDTMCGAFGSMDKNCKDDYKLQNGTQLDLPCSSGSSMPVAQFVDSWVTDPTVDNCVLGQVVQNNTKCNLDSAAQSCALIQNAINGNGPFAACAQMGTDVLQQYLNDCIYDVCRGQSKCDALSAFALTCQTTIPFADISSWRDGDCPYYCPSFSAYSLRTPNCQNTCSNPFLGNTTFCQDGYHEGCICAPGYYLDTNSDSGTAAFRCIPLASCGCNDVFGNYFLPNTTWLNANCSLLSSCQNGYLESHPVACSRYGQCINVLGQPSCECEPGFTGNGYLCSDIDECANSTVCGAALGHGVCVNDPGSYHCVCNAPYGGADCTSYLPRRHCADLYVYHGNRTDGVYEIQVGATYGANPTAGIDAQVYCDMAADGGGWTLINGGNETSDKKFAEYETGFGDPSSRSAWLGLKQIYVMTNQTATSLRVVIERCPGLSVPDQVTECTYPQFSVHSAQEGYAVYIPSYCQNGNESNPRYDGWVRWPLDQVGPKFVASDNDDTKYKCSTEYLNTGWWFYAEDVGSLCGAANLNGVHYQCNGTNVYNGYLTWHYDPVENGWMYLRPQRYPDYDNGSF